MILLNKLNQNKTIVCKLLCTLSFVSFLSSISTQVYFSNSSAIKSNEMIAFNERKDVLEEEIDDLARAITSVSCLSHIENLAREKGFVDMEGTLLVVKPSTVAMAR